jgi:Protein of unknown function (DUF2490)
MLSLIKLHNLSKVKKAIIAITYFVITALGLSAQETDVAQSNDLWMFLNGNYEFENKWSIGTEFHFRYANWGDERQQFIFRPSTSYVLDDQVKFTLGYTFTEYYPYGEQPIPTRVPEHNIWMQVLLKQSLKSLKVSHRFRFEQRWIGHVTNENGERTIHEYVQRKRVRYHLSLQRPLSSNSKFYAKIFNEIWINYGNGTGQNIFNQNWLSGGIGYHLSPAVTTEISYLWRFINKPDGIHQESNNTFQAALKYSFQKSSKNGKFKR